MRVYFVTVKVAIVTVAICATSSSYGQDTPVRDSANKPSPDSGAPENASSTSASTQLKTEQTGIPTLSYYSLMNVPFKVRYEFLDRYPPEERGKFLDSLSGARRAVVATDPSDCGKTARFMRASFANGKQADGIVAGTLKDVGSSVLGSLLGGAGNILSGAAKINEGQKFFAYKDICDVSKEERDALLFPRPDGAYQAAEPKPTEETVIDKASEFLSR